MAIYSDSYTVKVTSQAILPTLLDKLRASFIMLILGLR
jgi:hypothetical protein